MDAQQAIEMRKEYLLPCLNHFYKNPPLFVKGEMQYLYDSNGKKYLDFFSGVSVMNCGYSNPYIVDKIIEQIKTLQYLTNIYITEPIVNLAEKLANILPDELNSSFFCASGSEANEGAMLLARLYTNKKKFIALENGLHGRTNLTMAATHIPMWRTDPFLPDDFYMIPNSSQQEESLKQLEQVLSNDDDICAFICEPIQGNGGIITPSDNYFTEVCKLLKQYGVLLIVDEIQTGFGRTGKMFAIEHYGVVPDIMTVSKAFGNGTPLAAFSTTKDIAKAFVKPSASTLGGNPVSCTAGMAVIDYINNNELVQKAKEYGEILHGELMALSKNHSCIKQIRGKGLMLGAEICDKNGNPDPTKVDEILENLKDRGIILGKNGLDRNVLAFQPPLVINKGDISFLIDNLGEVL